MAYEIWDTCMLVPGISKSNCSGWVQAWGSILAICAAIVIAWWQRFDDRRHSKTTGLAAAEIVADTVLLAVARTLGIISATQEGVVSESTKAPPTIYSTLLLRTLQRSIMPTDEQLLQLATIWPAPARELSHGRSAFIAVTSLLEHYSGQYPDGVGLSGDEISDLIDLLQDSTNHFLAGDRGIRPESSPEKWTDGLI